MRTERGPLGRRIGTCCDGRANMGPAASFNNSDVAIGFRIAGSTDKTIQWSSSNVPTNLMPVSDSAGVAIDGLGQLVGTLSGGSGGYYRNGAFATGLGLIPTDINNAR